VFSRFTPMLALGLALTILASAGCADRLVLPPVPSHVQWDGSERRLVRWHRGTFEVFVAQATGSDRGGAAEGFVLRFTGDAAGAARFTASRWNGYGVEVWVVNYPGYGASSGPRSLRQLAWQALAAFDAIKRVAGERPVYVEGFSLGTVPALYLAAQRPVNGIIVQNPPPLRELILGEHGWWNLWLLAGPVALGVPREFDNIENARRVKVRGVFLIAERDRTIPPRYQWRIAGAFGGERRVIVQRGADHVEPLKPAEVEAVREAVGWIVEEHRARHSK
jgi:hypothetical protein